MIKWFTLFMFLVPVLGCGDKREEQSLNREHDEASRPVAGVENTIPWPVPLAEGAQALTFRGQGNTTTETFTLEGDAALRIAAEAGPFKLQVQREDGTYLSDVVDLEDGGMALMAIPESGSYRLEIEAPARWGVTVVH